MSTLVIERRKIEPDSLLTGNTTMKDILIITADSKTKAALQQVVIESGFTCMTTACEDALETMARRSAHLVLVEINSHNNTPAQRIIGNIKKDKKVPVIALIPADVIEKLDNVPDVDDFITGNYNSAELALRIKRLVHGNGNDTSSEQIKCNGLTIDLATCEVTVNRVKAELTYKEYELLKLLASNKGRVFTRQALLDKIWGYDYFGGDRTVDVHIRRLRSKIEDATHIYIETVRNIGYRFTKSL